MAIDITATPADISLLYTKIYTKKQAETRVDFRLFCDSYRIQTCNLLIRSQMLYSVELRSLSGVQSFS